MSKTLFDAKASATIDRVLFISGGIVLTITAMAGIALTINQAQAVDTSSELASVTVTSSCQLGSHIDSAHSAELTASTYQDNIGKTTFTVACNDVNGYAVYAVGYTNTEFGRNDMLGASTGLTIDTGTATSGQTSAWAMKLTSVQGQVAPNITTGYSSYHTVPDDYVKVASYDDSTMRDQTGSQFETTYAVYANSLQAPDTYNGKVKYTLVHPNDSSTTPCVDTYTINYAANGGSGTMDSQIACIDRAISTLPNSFTAPSPANENQFALWNTAADGSGYTYTARQSVTNLAQAGGSITLYAQWAPKYIQDLTSNTCSIVANEAPFTVYDRRDGNDYTVRYLQGACWMTQNLRITGTVNQQYSNFSTYSNVNVCEGDLTSGNSYDEPRCHDSGNTTYGVWYNYAAASAKTILTSSNKNEATEDICPAGWHLPNYSGDTSSISSLSGMDSVGVAAFTPVVGGYYVDGTISTVGPGRWWSSTGVGLSPYSARYYLNYNGSSLTTNDANRRNGNYIRCVRQ